MGCGRCCVELDVERHKQRAEGGVVQASRVVEAARHRLDCGATGSLNMTRDGIKARLPSIR